MNGMPVSPSRPVTASGLSTSKLPPNANCTSFHSAPASPSAARMASAPMSMADFGPNRPKGCSPTPMIATSSMSAFSFGLIAGRRERVGHDLGAVLVDPERDDHQLHVHPDPQCARVALGEAGFDLHLVAQLHHPDAVRAEGLHGLAAGVGLLREEVLGGEGPQGAPAG